ncbi:MAG TPA: M4 family metallopeptidase [Haliangiales bacterium]|nr:M4 family metallopeptidase [Haliangiales bacterium]
MRKRVRLPQGHVPTGCPVCSIIPSHILRHLSRHGPQQLRERMLQTLQHSERLRGHRDMLAYLGAVALATPTGTKRRTIYDLRHGTKLPGQLVRDEGDPRRKDQNVNEAYDYSGATYDFYDQVFGRSSVDGNGMRLDSSVHYSTDYDNAFWNGAQMVYGDGDGVIFERFTKCLDVIGHELTHGVTQFEAALAYHDQPGALNESFSDVFGALVKQWNLKQTADQADWLIGAGLLAKGINGVALRSMKAPGTAYDDPQLGKDPQPAHMKDYNQDSADNGGVHINSGIPNHAFYRVATSLGGFAWDKAGKIWYDTLTNVIGPNTSFEQAADATIRSAGNLYGNGSQEQQAVQSAWKQVGVLK